MELNSRVGEKRLDGVRLREQLSLLAELAIATQVTILLSAWLVPFVSEFSLIGDSMSELVLGRFGFIQTSAFLLAGLGTLGLAFAIRSLTKGVRGSLLGSLLIGLYGSGALLVAIFPTDRIDSAADVWTQSTSGSIHVVSALISFVCVIIGMFVLTRTFARHPSWRSLMPWSALFPASALALLLVQQEGPIVGLMQRLLVAVIASWLILVAFKVRSIVASSHPHRL
jgi:hypothetical protein